MARYNILRGMTPPASGDWRNNPDADDIDFQIESDFIGLMSPGMPAAAADMADRVGHIMNSGDGWYGGVYIATMYSLAFTSTDVNYVVTEGLKAIPVGTRFYQTISGVIDLHKQYPDDWKRAWFEIQKKWAEDVGCADGVFAAFDIDARLERRLRRAGTALRPGRHDEDHRDRDPRRPGLGLQSLVGRGNPRRDHRLLEDPGVLEAGALPG